MKYNIKDYCIKFWLLIFITGFWTFFGHAQGFKHPKGELREKILEYNLWGKYEKAQDLILRTIDSGEVKEKDKVFLYLHLSDTYKYLQDYATAIKHLKKAQNIADHNMPSDSLTTQIDLRLALVFFDIGNYYECRNLVTKLQEKEHFLSSKNKSKLRTQEGLLFFTDQKYKKAEQSYQKAVKLLERQCPCDLSYIYVQKMKLYEATKKYADRDKQYQLAYKNADDCAILKNKIYATKMYVNIFKNKGDVDNTFKYQTLLDSLIAISQPNKSLAHLHLQKEEKILSELNTHKANKKKEVIIVAFIIVFLLILGAYLTFNLDKDKRTTHKELVKTRDELNQIKEKIAPTDKSTKEILKKLSKRQREVLALILETNYTYEEIAEKLYISHSTVKFHFKNIYAKFNVSNRTELLNLFRKS